MFHMLTCFDLASNATISAFEQSLSEFTTHMKNLDLVHSTGRIGRRQRHPIMDTDSERDHEFFFIMSFRDREQCDQAVDYIMPREEPGEPVHKAMYLQIENPVFICWEDLAPQV